MDAFRLIVVALCAISLLLQSTLLCDAYVYGSRATESWKPRRYYIPLDTPDDSLEMQPFGFNSLWSSINKNADNAGTPLASGYGKIEASAAAPQLNTDRLPQLTADTQQPQAPAAPVTDSTEANVAESRLLRKWAKYLRKEQQQKDSSTEASSETAAPSVTVGTEQLPPLRRIAHDDVLVRPIGRNLYQVREGQEQRPVRVELGEVEEHDDLPSLSI